MTVGKIANEINLMEQNMMTMRDKITLMTNDRITDDDDDDKSDDRWQCGTLGGCSLEWFTEQRMHTISETCFDMMIRMKRNFQQWEPCNILPYITTSDVQ